MYQGKFDQKRKKTSVDVSEIVSERNSTVKAAPAQRAEAPVKEKAPAKASAPAKAPKAPADAQPQQPTKTRSAAKAQPAPAGKSPAKKQPARQTAPQPVSEAAPEKKKKKGPRLGGVIFYTLYFLFIFLFFVAVYFGLNWLHGWLADYQLAQPTVKCEEVFTQLFSDPDWGQLYDTAGVERTTFEGKDAFVAYMEAKVGDQQLDYMETSAGLSGDKKYNVRLGNEKIATFTLVDANHAEAVTDLPDWQLGSIELFYEYSETFRIVNMDSHIVYVNDVPLDESYTIQRTSSVSNVSGFLPDDVSVAKTCVQEISGLMQVPTVTIYDKSGNQMEVTYDEATHTFTEQVEAITISEEEKELALTAMKTSAEYQIKEATANTVAKYFDGSSSAYKSIIGTDLSVTRGNNGYSFANDSVTSYNRYSDTMFSVYVSTELTIQMKDGGTTVKDVHATLLFEKLSGKWKVTKMTNADISQPVGEVRLTFIDDLGNVISSNFYKNDIASLTTPVISEREGKTFAGWAVKTVDETGTTTMTIVFTPDESATVTLPDDNILEPMTLYAVYNTASAAAETTPETEAETTPDTTEGV